MEVTEEYSVWNAERGMSEINILLFAEGYAKEYRDCIMFRKDKIFREYKNGLDVEEHECTL